MEQYFQIDGTDLTIRMPRELDHHHAESLRHGADWLVKNRNIRRIIFDFAETRFMDSSGIGVIMGRYNDMRFLGGTVTAIHVSERIRRLLTLSGVSRVLEIQDGLPQQSDR